MPKHGCLHEDEWRDIYEIVGMVKNELKNLNKNFDEIKVTLGEIQGKPIGLTKIWTILVIILVSMFGGVGAAKFLF